MKKSPKWVMLSILLPFISFAQSNFKPGYLVDLKNDTVKGYIDYREWKQNPRSFNFKTNPNSTVQKLTASNTQAFGIASLEYFERAVVSISAGNVEVGSLAVGVDTARVTDTVFLRTVTTGKGVSLYYLTDNIKTRFYIKDVKDGRLKELDYFVYLDADDNSSVKTIYAYRTQLLAFAYTYQPDNKSLVQRIQSAGYSETELKAIANTINGGSNTQFLHDKLSAVRFFAGAGITANKLTFSGENGPFPDGTSRSHTAPEFSAGADLILNKNTQKVVFRAELMAAANHYNFNLSTPGAFIINSSLDVKQLNISVIPQFIYNVYSTPGVKAFLGAGVAFNFAFYNDYHYLTMYSDGQVVNEKKYAQFDKMWYSFPLKAGVLLNNKLEIFGSYWLSSPILSNTNYAAHVIAYKAGINFLFGK
ncbi:hypothetical protein [Mucilaginibacter sp.]|uniref:hypothetical protein n=1 Tax=Mucilaginibacter sp. TaxID=1882438 RepID=UPI0025EAFF4D|nr:hypothetical protein [Mucilaginibacter sp.]